MLKRVISYLVIAAMVLFAGSCIKETLDMNRFSNSIEITPGLAMPVGYGSLSIGDLLNRFNKTGYIKTDSSGLVSFAYSSDLVSVDANTAFRIPNQIYDQFFIRSDVPVPVLIPATDSVVIQKSNNYAFNFGNNGKNMKHGKIKGGAGQGRCQSFSGIQEN